MKKISNIIIFILSMYSLLFIVIAILPPILAYFGYYDISGKITFWLSGACHQKPTHTFWFLGFPLALCCRCFGFYIGCVISSIIIFIKNITISKFVILITLYGIIDLFINYALSINTGRYSKFISGICLGTIFIIIINYILKKEGEKE